MEVAAHPDMPTYAGGLGVLAGDFLRSAADLGLPIVAVSLLARRNYFHQRLDASGWQHEEYLEWNPADHLEELPQRTAVEIEGRRVEIRAWRFRVAGVRGSVPIYFLDTDLEENTEADRALSHYLYGGDERYRLAQEVVLGIGGVRMLRALGHGSRLRFHMNEGHSALLVLELLQERTGGREPGPEDLEAVRSRCVFTTHTPVAAGHDRFPLGLVERVLGPSPALRGLEKELCCNGELNLTYLALVASRYVNGVAKRHGEVSRKMFQDFAIDSITNGVHVATWASAPIRALFDRHIPDWRESNASLRYVVSVPLQEIWDAHSAAKAELLGAVEQRSGVRLRPDVLTLGFARRATAYKRPDLLFADEGRLAAIAETVGPLQVLYAGKAHPRDHEGKVLIQRVHQAAARLQGRVSVVYLENYDLRLASLLTSGVDVWLNTPMPPLEASGTSGMKAAVNGVPSLSVLDGWWIEGCIEGVTGWAIGNSHPPSGSVADRYADAFSLYAKLEAVVAPLYYAQRDGFIQVMRGAIAFNGSFFHTERMASEYVTKAYFR